MDERPINPEFWQYPAMRRALAHRDITVVYTILTRGGIKQRHLAALTGQSQSEVCEILKGRAVQKVTTLERIADGLGVPYGFLGLAFSEVPTYRREQGKPVGDEVSENMKRRIWLAAAAAAVVDRPVFGQVLAIAAPAPAQPMTPTELVAADVTALQALTAQFQTLGRAGHGGMPEVIGPVATRAERMLMAPRVDTPQTVPRFRSALAELHTLAGWCCFDMRLTDAARWHYSRALTLARDAGDVLVMVSAARHLSVDYREAGLPDDALKLYQMAQIKLDELPDSTEGKPQQQMWLRVQAAQVYADLNRPDRARDELIIANRFPLLADPFERADMDTRRGSIELAFGKIGTAESYAANSLRTWGPDDRRDSVRTRILLAQIHTRAGEAGVERLAAPAINAVAELRSARTRTLLLPLEQALRARGDSTSVDLADRAHQVRQN